MDTIPQIVANYDLARFNKLVADGIINPYSRRQKTSNFFTRLLPPKNDGLCDCGCGTPITGRQTRWSSSECASTLEWLWRLCSSDSSSIRRMLYITQGDFCKHCGVEGFDDVDHILPVHKGGGGMGLWNFQGLCKSCHKAKTRIDVKK